MKTIHWSAGLFIVVLFWPLAAGAIPYSNLYVFGDSLSDTGNMSAATGGALPPSSYYFNGRSSNGSLWVEHLSPSLGLPYQQATNYAWLGAGTGHDNAWDADFPSFDFFGLADEIDYYTANLGGGTADPNALYVVWAGPNDFLTPMDPTLIPAAVANGVTNIATAVVDLASVGAQHFMVPTMPDLGLTPRAQFLGVSAGLSGLSGAFNGALQTTLMGLGLDIIMPDVAGLMQDIVADPLSYGLGNATDWCFSDLELAAGLIPAICANPDEYLFWDTVHPSAAGHALIADLFVDSLAVPEPGAWALLLVGYLLLIPARRTQALHLRS